MDHLPDAVRRGLRTFVQAFTGTLLLLLVGQGIPSLVASGKVPDLSLLLTLAEAAALAGVIALLAWAQNWAEDNPNVPLPALLKSPASAGTDPVPDSRPRLEPH
jgi:hypothetical protein